MLKKGLPQFSKLSCRWRYGSLLSSYHDNELNAPTTEIVAGHLRECARCRVEFEQMRFASRAMSEFEVPPSRGPLSVGQVFPQPVSAEVSTGKRLYSRTIAVPLPLAASVVIALIAVTLFAIGRNQRTPTQSTVSIQAPPSEVIKVVEVPVERVVTRTVYTRQPGSRRVRGEKTTPDLKADIARNANRSSEWTASTLRDFRPAASANLRVVKGNEK